MKYVKHLKKTEWGIGKVIDVENHKIKIDFLNGGVKLLNSRIALLEEIIDEGEIGKFKEDKLLTSLATKKSKKTSVDERVPLVDLIKVFSNIYQGGFDNEEYIKAERKSKLEISKTFKELFSKESLENTIEKKDYLILCEKTKKLISATKIIHSIEKTNFRKAISVEENQEKFVKSIYEVLYTEETITEVEFNKFKTFLGSLNCNKWTILTYFLNMIQPEKYPFLKPKVSKKASDIFGFDLNYNMIPNWSTYNSFLKYTQLLEKELVELQPKDYIDIENFIWITIKNLNTK